MGLGEIYVFPICFVVYTNSIRRIVLQILD